eukprot:1387722-Prorocentrum_lima.AAC.1
MSMAADTSKEQANTTLEVDVVSDDASDDNDEQQQGIGLNGLLQMEGNRLAADDIDAAGYFRRHGNDT